MAQLCIVPGKFCWNLFVDALVLDTGGSVVDSLVLATYAALRDTLIPRLRIVTGETPDDVEVEIDDDPSACVAFATDGVPVTVTFVQVAGASLVDAREEEEACAESVVVASVNRCVAMACLLVCATLSAAYLCHRFTENAACASLTCRRGNVCSVTAGGAAGVSPAALHATIEAARELAPALFARVDAAVTAASVSKAATAAGRGRESRDAIDVEVDGVGSAGGAHLRSELLAEVGVSVVGRLNRVKI